MSDEEFTAWITKHALTSGIIVRRARLCSTSSNMIELVGERYSAYFHGNEWHKTEEEAMARAEEMRTKKIANMKKQIAKLEALSFAKKDAE